LFSADDIDMSTRAGRLLADIIMSIAKGYIDNLREETLKGLYGRLKQGLYPWKAPKGYLDTGGGNIKEIDPALAPLIREAFELYSRGDKSLGVITRMLAPKGLLSPSKKEISKNTLSLILHNPFYIGLMKVKGEVFRGKHQPLISNELFNDVQKIFSGKFVKKTKNKYMYRGIFNCVCGRKLVGEKQRQ